MHGNIKYDYEEVKRLNLLGVRDIEICRLMGMSPATLSEWKDKNNIPSRNRCKACDTVFVMTGRAAYCGECGLRKCNICDSIKPETKFRVSDRYGGRRTQCVECETDYKVFYSFGIRLADKRVMYEKQDGNCWLCKEGLKFEAAHIDHDHSCLECGGSGCPHCIRGLVHHTCNTVIGFVNESPERLRAIANSFELWKNGTGQGRGIPPAPSHPNS